MGEKELDFTFIIIVVSLLLLSFTFFVVRVVIVFNKRAIKYKEHLAKVELEQSRKLLKSTLKAQEKERRRIGIDIHDDIGPLLSLLKLQLNSFNNVLDITTQKQNVRECKKTIDSVIENVRRVSRDLAPSVLYELGLEAALTQLEEKLRSFTDASIEFDIDFNLETIGPSQSLALYRILQESLNNVLRHAKARHILIKIYSEKDFLKMIISDDGIGFDYEKDRKGFGLNNIEARVNMFKGTLIVLSDQKEGTKIIVKMKVNE